MTTEQSSRDLFQTQGRARNEIREVLQAVFTAELLLPSKSLWLVSPWITNESMINNETGSFRALTSDSTRTHLGLAQILSMLFEKGTAIHVVTKPLVSTNFVQHLRRLCRSGIESGRVQIIEKEELHAKGLIGDTYCISGSMNFTFSGMTRNSEILSLTTDKERISRLRTEVKAEYGI